MAERTDQSSSGNDVETSAAPVDVAPVAGLPNEASDNDIVTLKTWIVVAVRPPPPPLLPAHFLEFFLWVTANTVHIGPLVLVRSLLLDGHVSRRHSDVRSHAARQRSQCRLVDDGVHHVHGHLLHAVRRQFRSVWPALVYYQWQCLCLCRLHCHWIGQVDRGRHRWLSPHRHGRGPLPAGRVRAARATAEPHPPYWHPDCRREHLGGCPVRAHCGPLHRD